MAVKSQKQGILRYLKDMVRPSHPTNMRGAVRAKELTSRQDYEFFELFGNSETRFQYDLERIARDAMTKGAQQRMTNATFPQELRLQVMKASVLYHSPTFKISSSTQNNTGDFTDAVKSLFDTQHAFGTLYETLWNLAEQVFFETAIFQVHIKLSDGHITAPLLDEAGGRVQHLELIARVLPGVSCEATLKEAAKVWTSLRHHTPNLKACVFTVVFRSCADLYPDHYYTNNETPFPITLLLDTHIPGECLGVTLTQLLAEFAEKGPGVRRFVRIRHLRCDVWRKTATSHCGPLIAVHSSRLEADAPGNLGGRSLLTEAYRLRRAAEEAEPRF
jgi:hypothetical protein